MFIEMKKFIKKCLILSERRIIVPFKIKFFSLPTATISEDIYEANIHGFESCVLFCHYNKYGLIIQQVRELCQFFQSSGIDVIFLTTKVSDESRIWLEKSVSSLIIRKNVGRDFGAWKDGITFLKKRTLFDSCSQLYLVNDSLIVISENLKSEKFKNDFINDVQTDVIGLTESWQQAYHLQSYFLKFNHRVIHSKFFCDYWLNYPLINSRLFSIENGEIAISQLVLKNAFHLKALYSVSELLKIESIFNFLSTLDILTIPNLSEIKSELFNEFFEIDFTNMNTSHRLWSLLLSNACPVLKKDLIDKNPERLLSMRYFMYFIEAKISNEETKRLLSDSLCHIKYLNMS